MNKISIHVAIKNIDSVIKNRWPLVKRTESIDGSFISCLWYEVSSFEEYRKVKYLEGEIDTKTVWVLKNPLILKELLKENGILLALGLKDLSIISSSEDLNFLVKKYRPGIFILQDEDSVTVPTDRDDWVRYYERAYELIDELGLNDSHFVYSDFDNLTDMIDTSMNIHERLDVPLVVPFFKGKNEDDSIVDNSLVMGNIFHRGAADTILLDYTDIDEFESKYESDVKVVKTILGSLGLVKTGYTIISCPKCGRCQMDLLKINEEVDGYLQKLEKEYNSRGVNLESIGGITVAVMGCNVNGPGEARGADIGIAGGKDGYGTIFKYGVPFKTLPEEEVVSELIHHVKTIIDKKIEDSGARV